MGMGHLHLRKIIKRDTSWIEKNTEKHKHEYNIPYILKTISPNKKTSYYRILKCTECNSFKSIPSLVMYLDLLVLIYLNLIKKKENFQQ